MNSFKTFLREVNLSWSFHKFPEIMTDLIDETKRDKCPLATSYIIILLFVKIFRHYNANSIIINFFVDKYVSVRLEYFP